MSKAIYAGNRLGIYYLEEGYAVRSSKVIYDRANSSFAAYDYSQIDFKELLKDFDWRILAELLLHSQLTAVI